MRSPKILVEKENGEKETSGEKYATYSLLAFALMLIGHFIFSYMPFQKMADDTVAWYHTLDKNFPWMVLAGFLAQMVDGAWVWDMALPVLLSLLSAGVSPAAISGSIHTAEMFASGASGYSHYKIRERK